MLIIYLQMLDVVFLMRVLIFGYSVILGPGCVAGEKNVTSGIKRGVDSYYPTVHRWHGSRALELPLCAVVPLKLNVPNKISAPNL